MKQHEQADTFTPYASLLRYGAITLSSQLDRQEAITIVRRVRQWVEPQIRKQ